MKSKVNGEEKHAGTINLEPLLTTINLRVKGLYFWGTVGPNALLPSRREIWENEFFSIFGKVVCRYLDQPVELLSLKDSRGWNHRYAKDIGPNGSKLTYS